MSVRLTPGAKDIVSACVHYKLPLTREGFNEACRRNRLLGLPDGRSVAVCVSALERSGTEGLLALAHADNDFRFEDYHPPRSEACRKEEHADCQWSGCQCGCHDRQPGGWSDERA